MKYKVVYNTAVSGGLHLSDEAIAWLKERGLTIEFDSGQSKGFVTNIPRHNYLSNVSKHWEKLPTGPKTAGFLERI